MQILYICSIERYNCIFNETIMTPTTISRALAIALAMAATSLSATARHEVSPVMSASASVSQTEVAKAFDNDNTTAWTVDATLLKKPQWIMATVANPGDVQSITLTQKGATADQLRKAIEIYVTYDPMNLGEPVDFTVATDRPTGNTILKFPAKYGAHVRLAIKPGVISRTWNIYEMAIAIEAGDSVADDSGIDRSYLDTSLPIDRRIEILLAQMTPEEKMELIREGWGIPGVKRLGIPDIKKVEAIHGYSYGTGATIFPQVLGMAASWNAPLLYKVTEAIGRESLDAGSIAAWSPVLDVATDPRWGRCEESFGEDPYLCSEMGKAWVNGYQSLGLITTSKHFGAHGAPLGGRDSHDVGFNEREMREIHLVPFRNVFRECRPQSVMMSYGDYMGVPVGKSKELLKGILRDEWEFDGFIVSDCGAIANMTSRKHYTALDKIEAANDALRAGIATNCGDTYNDKEVIRAATEGRLDMTALDDVCRDMLRVMFRTGLFENNPSRPLNWDKQFPSWQSPEHVALAREMARQSIVLLKNEDSLLPLSDDIRTIAVIGPGADNLQLGDYSGKQLPGQIKSVLDGIKASASPSTGIIYSKGCGFTTDDPAGLADAVETASKADVALVVLGDYSGHPSIDGEKRPTSGENHDLASLRFQGMQQELLDAVCATGTPVVLVAQIGRPYDLSSASRQTKAIIVNWLPGQEGGLATADVLFGNYNPAGRLPMTFPQSAAQLPLNYNFKTSGRRYEYVDMDFYPLYRFGYGLSYTTFAYSNLRISTLPDGNVEVKADITNTGSRTGDEVAQLYITDMYASVKTRVMELKGFRRITIEPGQTHTVTFTLTPYDLSLLNVDMDRVVEPGDFKIMVGGMSPDFTAKDRIKDSLGYPEGRGVTGTLRYDIPAAARYEFTITDISHNLTDGSDIVTVNVTNSGNLTDTGQLTMYVDGTRTGDTRHYELNPGQSKAITFTVPSPEGIGSPWKSLNFISRHSSIFHNR